MVCAGLFTEEAHGKQAERSASERHHLPHETMSGAGGFGATLDA